MKKFIKCYILFSIVAAIFIASMYSVVIVGDYFINKKFIVEQLCEQKEEIENTCQGKCHLAKKLKEAEPTAQNSPKSLPELISYFSYFAVEDTPIEIKFNTFSENVINNFHYQYGNYNAHLSKQIKPPIQYS